MYLFLGYVNISASEFSGMLSMQCPVIYTGYENKDVFRFFGRSHINPIDKKDRLRAKPVFQILTKNRILYYSGSLTEETFFATK